MAGVRGGEEVPGRERRRRGDDGARERGRDGVSDQDREGLEAGGEGKVVRGRRDEGGEGAIEWARRWGGGMHT